MLRYSLFISSDLLKVVVELGSVAVADVRVSFAPHLVPSLKLRAPELGQGDMTFAAALRLGAGYVLDKPSLQEARNQRARLAIPSSLSFGRVESKVRVQGSLIHPLMPIELMGLGEQSEEFMFSHGNKRYLNSDTLVKGQRSQHINSR
jgi:hypothetical protein